MVLNPLTWKILLHYLTKDYALDSVSPEVKMDELVELMRNVCATLANLLIDDIVCQEINEKYDIQAILN